MPVTLIDSSRPDAQCTDAGAGPIGAWLCASHGWALLPRLSLLPPVFQARIPIARLTRRCGPLSIPRNTHSRRAIAVFDQKRKRAGRAMPSRRRLRRTCLVRRTRLTLRHSHRPTERWSCSFRSTRHGKMALHSARRTTAIYASAATANQHRCSFPVGRLRLSPPMAVPSKSLHGSTISSSLLTARRSTSTVQNTQRTARRTRSTWRLEANISPFRAPSTP